MSVPILGIDFGTTNSAAAYFDPAGKLRLVPVKDKAFTLPTVVWFHAADKAIVGYAARTQIVDDPRHTLFGTKRFLGRRFQSEFVATNKDRFAFELVEGPDGYSAAMIYDVVKPLTEVAYRIIDRLATLAMAAAGARFTQCVLTAPAHASIRQREALRQAAERAGLQVRAIVNEPTAAALYYANLRNPEQTVLVFDLGGGTFDATLISVQNRRVRVLATGGDAFLGGANFDEMIVERLTERFENQHGVRIRDNPIVMQRLLFAAEAAKISLSQQEETRIRVPCIAQHESGFLDFDFTLTRKEMEAMVEPLVERTASACDDLLQRAGLRADQVDELVLVGGQTRMPAIRERFTHFKRFSSEKDVHPELGVAVGAAVLGRNLTRGASGLSDVVPMSISAMIPGGKTMEIIAANTPVPATALIALSELPMWSAPVPIAILESLDQTSVERELLGTVTVPPDWRLAQKGAGHLELRMGQDFVLTARLVAAGGQAVEAKLVDPRPQASS